MIDKVFGWLGFVRVSKLNEDDINKLLVDFLFSVKNYNRDSNRFDAEGMEEVREVFTKHPIIKDFLDWTIVQDVKRFYSSGDAEHPVIRGAISRTRYFRTLCLVPREEESKLSKLDLKRYINNLK